MVNIVGIDDNFKAHKYGSKFWDHKHVFHIFLKIFLMTASANLHKNKKASTILRLSMLCVMSGWLDSNQRPHAPQTRTLTNWATSRNASAKVMRIFYFANALLEKIFTRCFCIENQAFCALLGIAESPSSLAESPSGLVVKLVCIAEGPSGLVENLFGSHWKSVRPRR